ncbi:MAG: catechol 2,3-dioxygenase-like lactoylglutathione lyase family enzyme [Bradymonadia bacterium]|jgi:catechol 2,3-dioxygenase-like lactoylglutathione lyase family enzyme
MLGHLSLGVSDLAHSCAFYGAALGALGVVCVWRTPDAAGYGVPGGGDKLAIKLRTPDGAPLAAGPGFHLAFVAESQAAVNAFYEHAIACGGRCNGEPGLRPDYGATYYAAFVIDADGHHLEAVCQ